jgi:hypothetical protein
MKRISINSWEYLLEWANQVSNNKNLVYRGQANNGWPLRTSLARHFLNNPVNPHEWRKRELKMYRLFRERLIHICPNLYDALPPIEILSLMQHHGLPTRLIDFTYSPFVAAYFAVINAQGDSAIWVIDTSLLLNNRKESGFPDYSGPSHDNGYKIATKQPGASIMKCTTGHNRLAAQHGCFLVPGHISAEISYELIDAHITISEKCVFETIIGLRGKGIDEFFLFPDLDKIAAEIKRFSVTGSAD